MTNQKTLYFREFLLSESIQNMGGGIRKLLFYDNKFIIHIKLRIIQAIWLFVKDIDILGSALKIIISKSQYNDIWFKYNDIYINKLVRNLVNYMNLFCV